MIQETLRKNRLFSGVSEEDMQEILPLFEERECKEDEHIFLEGEKSDKLYLACQGRVKIVKHTAEGKDVILEIISPPDVFGGVAVLDGRAYPASAQAMEKCVVASITRKRFLELVDRYHVIAVESSMYFGERLRNAYDMLRSISVERVERRIAALLIKFGERVGKKQGDCTVMELGLTMQEIAEMVGTTVETTIRTMNKFKREGLVAYGKGPMVLSPKLWERQGE